MSMNVKPCPYCGKDPLIEARRLGESEVHRIYCVNGKCEFECSFQFDEEKSIKKWNDRATLSHWFK